MIFFVCVRLQMRTTIVVCHSFLARMANAFQGTGGATMKMIVKIIPMNTNVVRLLLLVLDLENLDYEEKLNRLGLMRLDRRRVRSDLLETFKIINGYRIII